MRRSVAVVLVVCCLIAAFPQLGDVTKQSILRSALSDANFRKMGLHKLSDSELAALEEFMMQLVQAAKNDSSTPGTTAVSYAELDGKAVIIAQDEERTFLGKVSSNKYDSKSIINDYGMGSKYKSESIMNEYGRFGGQFGRYSPFNEYCTSPPMVFIGERFAGYLTKNKTKSPRIDPDALIGYLKSK